MRAKPCELIGWRGPADGGSQWRTVCAMDGFTAYPPLASPVGLPGRAAFHLIAGFTRLA